MNDCPSKYLNCSLSEGSRIGSIFPKPILIKLSTALLVVSIIIGNPYKINQDGFSSDEVFAAEKKPKKIVKKVRYKKNNKDYSQKKVVKESTETNSDYTRESMYSVGMTKDFVDAYLALKKLIDDDILTTGVTDEFSETILALNKQLNEARENGNLNSDFQYDLTKIPISLRRLGLNSKTNRIREIIGKTGVTENNWSDVTVALQDSYKSENSSNLNFLFQSDALKKNLGEKGFQNSMEMLNKLIKKITDEDIGKGSLNIIYITISSGIGYLLTQKDKTGVKLIKIEAPL